MFYYWYGRYQLVNLKNKLTNATETVSMRK